MAIKGAREDLFLLLICTHLSLAVLCLGDCGFHFLHIIPGYLFGHGMTSRLKH